MRRSVLIGGVVLALGLAVFVLLPAAMIELGDRQRDEADSQADLVARVAGWEQARRWYRRAGRLPLYTSGIRTAEGLLDDHLAAAFEQQRLTLGAGAAGVPLHLDWLEQRVALPHWDGEQARLERVRALVSYGQLDQAQLLAADLPGPFARTWRGIAALHSGQLAALPPELHEQMPGLALQPTGAPWPEQAGADDLSRLVSGEHSRRKGQTLDARRILAPLLAGEGLLAAAAAQVWGLSLIDELSAEPAGAMLVGTEGQLEPLALAGLRARLLLAPTDDPAWAGAWLALAELDARRGSTHDAEQAAWAAVALTAPLWAPAPGDLAAMARLDAPAALHPDRIQRARVTLGEARVAAVAAGLDVADLAHAEAALLLLQGRAHLSARDLGTARARFARAAELVPSSPSVIGWQVLAALLDDDAPAARAALDSLPSLDHTEDDDALRQLAAGWLAPQPVSVVSSPARALRARLRSAWDPAEPVAFALAHADRADDLALALGSPPVDRATVAQALAQAHLHVRIDAALGRPDPAPVARRDSLRDAALTEPLWALYALDAFTLEGPQLPAPTPPAGMGRSASPGPAQIPR